MKACAKATSWNMTFIFWQKGHASTRNAFSGGKYLPVEWSVWVSSNWICKCRLSWKRQTQLLLTTVVTSAMAFGHKHCPSTLHYQGEFGHLFHGEISKLLTFTPMYLLPCYLSRWWSVHQYDPSSAWLSMLAASLLDWPGDWLKYIRQRILPKT